MMSIFLIKAIIIALCLTGIIVVFSGQKNIKKIFNTFILVILIIMNLSILQKFYEWKKSINWRLDRMWEEAIKSEGIIEFGDYIPAENLYMTQEGE